MELCAHDGGCDLCLSLYLYRNINELSLGLLGYFCYCGPLRRGEGVLLTPPPPSGFYIIDHMSINVICMGRSTNYLYLYYDVLETAFLEGVVK